MQGHIFIFPKRAGIMVTHELRMCKYVDRVLQMRDGKLVQVIEEKDEIERLATGGLATPVTA